MNKLLVACYFLFIFISPSAFADSKLKVIASFSIIADMTKEVAKDHIDLSTLVSNDGDTHEYEATPMDAKMIANADLVFVNGLGFEGWMDRLIKSSGYKGKVVVVSKGIKALNSKEGQDEHHHDHHHLTDSDPHAWQDLSNAIIYVNNIKDALIEADPKNAEDYSKNAATYSQKLSELDRWAKNLLANIPPLKRKVISTHDAFQYFANAYNIQFISAQGISTQSQASAKDIARLIDQLRINNVSTVFLENMTDSRLMKQLEKDAGAKIGGTLYSDSLSSKQGAAYTYIDMFTHNVNEIVKAIK